MKARLIFHNKLVDADGFIIEMKIWRVPAAVAGSAHHLKYSLFYGRPGERIVGYDNEAGKGDHRHRRSSEDVYKFTTVEQLITNFMADVELERSNQP